MSTVGCSLNVNFHGLFGDGSPTTMSSIMARIRMITAVRISVRMLVHHECMIAWKFTASDIISITVVP